MSELLVLLGVLTRLSSAVMKPVCAIEAALSCCILHGSLKSPGLRLVETSTWASGSASVYSGSAVAGFGTQTGLIIDLRTEASLSC